MAEIDVGNGVMVSAAPTVDVQVVQGRTRPGGRRAAPSGAPENQALRQALREAGFEIAAELVIAPRPAPRRGRRGPAPQQTQVKVKAAPGESAVLLVESEGGVFAWTLPGTDGGRRGARRTARRSATQRTLVFDIEAAPVRRGRADGARRGAVLEWITERLVEPVRTYVLKFVVNVGIDVAMDVIEGDYPEGLIALTGDQPEAWLPGGSLPTLSSTRPARILLLVHGTFSSTSGGFAQLVTTRAGRDFLARARRHYDAVLGFDHKTLVADPETNAAALLDALETLGLPQDSLIDAVAHSRGGLVYRCFAETLLPRQRPDIRLGKAVFVAGTHSGTHLAEPKNWAAMIDLYTNAIMAAARFAVRVAGGTGLNAIVTQAIKTLGQFVKLLSEVAIADNQVPGLAAMQPTSALIRALNAAQGGTERLAVYYAVTSNFVATLEPRNGITRELAELIIDRVTNRLFQADNDLVVDTSSMTALGTRTVRLQAGATFAFGSTDDIYHTIYFADERVPQHLLEWLELTAIGRRLEPQRRAAALAAGGSSPPPGELDVQAPPALRARRISQAGTFSDAFQLTVLKPERRKVALSDRKNEPDEDDLQLLASYGGARVIEPFPIRNEKWDAKRGSKKPSDKTNGSAPGTRLRRIIAFHEKMKDYVDGKPGVYPPTDAQLLEYGQLLFEALFTPEVKRLYDTARSRERSHLNVIFTSMVPWIADKPWEFAFDPDRQTFLATEDVHFIRNAITAIPADKLEGETRPLKILVAVAQPVGSGKLSSEQEKVVIRRGFAPLVEAGLVELDILPSATPDSLHQRLCTGEFHVLHFIGHGEFDEHLQEGALLFEGSGGSAYKVDVRSMREIVCRRGVRLVFLNACDTGRGARADFNRGMAPGLIAGGIPAVVANQFKVLDVSATEFAQHFYWALAQGMTLGQAAREARIGVNYSMGRENIDWAVPVVYARDPESRLCAPSETTGYVPLKLAGRGMRRSLQPGAERVGIWDINGALPELQAAISAMNGAQSDFQFEIVEISAPIGSWVSPKHELVQINANVAAERLKYKARQLGVTYLLCIAADPIMEDDGGVNRDSNLYGWWSDPGQGNIMIFSISPKELPVTGLDANRAVANAAVQGLTGILGDTGTHSRGPRTCPLAYDPRRDVRLLITRQHFDPTCRKLLKRKKEIRNHLPALEKLLRLFD